jgi:hypothetical protein
MNAILRNSLLVAGIAGGLALAACKSDHTMDNTGPTPSPAPAEQGMPPASSTTTMPAPTSPTDSTPPPVTTPPTPPNPPNPPTNP